MTRLDWVDYSKGAAIFLMVVGHVIAWSFPNYRDVLNDKPNPLVLWRLIYAFHMPLLMFISGFLCARHRTETRRDLVALLKKQTFNLVIPDIVMTILLSLYRRQFSGGFWYLEVLFVFVLALGAVDVVSSRIRRRESRIFASVCCALVFGCLVSTVCRVVPGAYRYGEMLPFFIGGVVAFRSHALDVLNDRRNAKIGFALLGILFFWTVKLQSELVPWSGLLAVICLFHCLPKIPFLSAMLRWMGVASLQIYTLHFFFKIFKPCLYGIGDLSIHLAKVYGCPASAAFQLVACSALAGIIILFVFLTVLLVERVPRLSQILFGRSSRFTASRSTVHLHRFSPPSPHLPR